MRVSASHASSFSRLYRKFGGLGVIALWKGVSSHVACYVLLIKALQRRSESAMEAYYLLRRLLFVLYPHSKGNSLGGVTLLGGVKVECR